MPLRYCANCGKRVATSARFCPACGAEQDEVFVREMIPAKLRFEVLKRDGHTCVYCGRSAPAVTLELDHVIPVSSGGRTDFGNLVTSCQDCNRGKGGNLLDDTQYLEYHQEQERLDKEQQADLLTYREIMLRRYQASARVDHAVFGYPVLQDRDNPLLVYLKNKSSRAWNNGITLKSAMESTLSELTVPVNDTISAKALLMTKRFEYGMFAHEIGLACRHDLHELYSQTQFDEVRDMCADSLDALDNWLEGREAIEWVLGPDHWHFPLTAHEDLRPSDLTLEILGVIPKGEMLELLEGSI